MLQRPVILDLSHTRLGVASYVKSLLNNNLHINSVKIVPVQLPS